MARILSDPRQAAVLVRQSDQVTSVEPPVTGPGTSPPLIRYDSTLPSQGPVYTTSCANPHCHRAVRDNGVAEVSSRRRRTPDTNTRLCRSCLLRLSEILRQLPVLYVRCGDLLQGERTHDPLPGRSGRREHGLVLNDALVGARSEIVAVTASWAHLILDEALLSQRPKPDVASLADFVARHQSFLADHPAAVDALDEFAAVHSRALRAIDPVAEARVLGTCDQPSCGTRVYAKRSPSTPGGRLVTCEAGHTWEPARWLTLRRNMERQSNMASVQTEPSV